MQKFIFSILCLVSLNMYSIDKLEDKYCVRLGKPQAKLEIIEYMSFSCYSCIKLYREDFAKIQEKFVDNGLISWTFHPVPMDLVTVQAMICLEKLSEKQKLVFLEAILSEIDLDNSELSPQLMMQALEFFKVKMGNLTSPDFVKSSPAFRDAFAFVNQKEKITEVPTIEINGKIYHEIPDFEFISKIVLNSEVLSE